MQYFAGLFDAEGYVSLTPNGAFTIALEITNEMIPNMFKHVFGGSIYVRKREGRKRCWAWKINSIQDQAINFIDSIVPFSIVKFPQLRRLRDYLDQPRKHRKETRSITCHTLKEFKKPILNLTHILPRIPVPSIEKEFFPWFAGFIDGDGNFTCYEYTDNRDNKKYFSHQICVANTFLEPIRHINDRIEGCITTLKGGIYPVFKWVPKKSSESLIFNSILPFLILKKEQCTLILEYSSIIGDRNRKYEIINQIKHLNSL